MLNPTISGKSPEEPCARGAKICRHRAERWPERRSQMDTVLLSRDCRQDRGRKKLQPRAKKEAVDHSSQPQHLATAVAMSVLRVGSYLTALPEG